MPIFAGDFIWYSTGRGGRAGRAQASSAGDREFNSRSSQTSDLQNLNLLLPNLVFSINRIGQGLVSSVSG